MEATYSSETYISPSQFPVALTLKHKESVKRFVLLQFLNPKTVGRTPWTGDQPVAKPLPTQTQTEINALSGLEPTIPVFEREETFHALGRTANMIGSSEISIDFKS
jgi:hypothetical protein